MGDAWSWQNRSLIGHNQGPPLDPGSRGAILAWRQARARAWQSPPPEVVRMRMGRAAALGLHYREYASVILDRGRTVRALLFPLEGTLIQPRRAGNPAVHADRAMPGAERRLAALACRRRIVVMENEGASGWTDWVRPELSIIIGHERTGRRNAVLAALRTAHIVAGEVAVIGNRVGDRVLAADIGAGLFVDAADWFCR